jgi:cell division protein FtsB
MKLGGMLKLFPGLANRVYESRHKLATGAITVLLAVLAYHAVFGANGLLMYEKKRQLSHDLALQNQVLNEENAMLEQQIKGLKSDPKMIEKEARERLRYARPGEVIYTLPASNAQPTPRK